MANQSNRPNLDRKGLVGSLGNLAEAAGFAAKTGSTSLGGMVKGSAKITGSTAKGAGGLLGGTITFVAKRIAEHPRLSFLVGLYAAAKGAQHLWRKHKEKKAAEAEIVQVDTPPQPAAMQGPDTGAAMYETSMQQPGGPSMPASAQLTAEQQAFLQQLQGHSPQQSAAAVSPSGERSWAEQVANRRERSAQESRTPGGV